MPVGRAWYVHGQKLAFPYGERWVSGPFDASDEAWDELRRIRPFYPDADLSPRLRSGKTLPEVKPRTRAPGAEVTAFNLRKAAGRRAAAEAIAGKVRSLGLDAVVEDWDGKPDVDCHTPSLCATIWLGDTPAAPMPIISWYGAKFPLRGVPGAWPADFNYWGSKATSTPRDWAELFSMLETGLLAAVDGTAFDLGAEFPAPRPRG